MPKVGQDAVLHAVEKDGNIGSGKLSSLDFGLQALNVTGQQIRELGFFVIANHDVVGIQLSGLDVEELFGLADAS
jgi:hypothetical protein